MYKVFIFLIFLVIMISGCKNAKNDLVTISFRDGTVNCDKSGMPNDSTVKYFPPELFNDTIPGFMDGEFFHRLRIGENKNAFAKLFERDIESLKDTFEIAEDTLRLKMRSYMLYKMKEPVLYSHYLDKDVYRLIALRSFHLPLLVRIEKYCDSVVIISKVLNKNVMYPFIKYINDVADDSIFFPSPDIITYKNDKMIILDTLRYNQELNYAIKFQDSVCKIYNNPDYHLILYKHKAIPISVWDSLQTEIDSTRFWKTKPDVALDYQQIDGSQWILEGHSRDGYQIRIIPSPHFETREFENNFDPKDNYARLFKHILKIADIK